MPSAAATRPTVSAGQTQGKRMALAGITKDSGHQANQIVLHGGPGIGKTELAAQFPGVVFLMTRDETGLLTLQQYNRIPKTAHFPNPAESWQDVLDAVEELTTGQHDYKTLAIDVLNGAERLCHEMVCARDFSNDWGEHGFGGYQRGFLNSTNDWRQLLSKLSKLRRERNMTIVCLCHTATKNTKNPLGPDYDSLMPAIHKDTWGLTNGWADMVLYMAKEIFVSKEKQSSKDKAKEGERIIYTDGNAGYVAKNRHGLPSEISMGTSGKEAYSNLIKAITEAKKGQ